MITGGVSAMMKTIYYKKRSVPVYVGNEQVELVDMLAVKLEEMSSNFDFHKRWKRIMSVQMVRGVAIFQYSDGTKLYLEVS